MQESDKLYVVVMCLCKMLRIKKNYVPLRKEQLYLFHLKKNKYNARPQHIIKTTNARTTIRLIAHHKSHAFAQRQPSLASFEPLLFSHEVFYIHYSLNVSR